MDGLLLYRAELNVWKEEQCSDETSLMDLTLTQNKTTKGVDGVGVRVLNYLRLYTDPSSPSHPPLPPHWVLQEVWQEL